MSRLTEDEKYLSAMYKDPLYFGKFMFPNYFTMGANSLYTEDWEQPAATFQYRIADAIANPPKKKTIVFVARNTGKSTIVSFLMPLWLILLRGYHYILVSSKTGKKANEFVADIKSVVNDEKFKYFFGNVIGEQWGMDGLVFDNPELNIIGKILPLGQGMQFPGLRFRQWRPQLAILDDIEDEKTVQNEEIIDSMVRKIESEIYYGLSSEKKAAIVIVGTSYKRGSMIEKMSEKDGVKVLRFPIQIEAGDEGEKLGKDLGLDIGDSIWEAAWPKTELEKEMLEKSNDGDLLEWRKNRMLDTRCDDLSVFMESDIQYFNPTQFRPKTMNWYVLVDWAHKKKKYADKAAIVMVGVTKNKHLYVLEVHEGRWGDNATIEKTLDMVSKYQEEDFNIQSAGAESYAWEMINKLMHEAMEKRNVSVPFIELCPKSRPKEDRIRRLISLNQRGKIHILQKHVALKGQMLKFHGEADQKGLNALDALAYILDVWAEPSDELAADDPIARQMLAKKIVDEFREELYGDNNPRLVALNEEHRFW